MDGIEILTFGIIAEEIGQSRFSIQPVATTDELKTRIEELYPKLKSMKYAIAVDKKIISNTTSISDNTTVALLPPFSGG